MPPLHPFVSSEVETPFRAQPSNRLGSARQGASTSLEANGALTV